ncbi:MAG TPA: hypothetical protein VFX60_17715 [Micromonospora sp.]|nr:hypothetical protein [Micromonospora sp.]
MATLFLAVAAVPAVLAEHHTGLALLADGFGWATPIQPDDAPDDGFGWSAPNSINPGTGA